tara:strand:+ start:1337 stop:1759 length:423 start_codon:yes stop_codon:yes gene_type:complete
MYLLLSIFGGILWGITTILEKYHLLKYFTAFEVYSFICSIVFIIFLVYLFNSNVVEKVIRLNNHMKLLLLITVIMSSLGSFLFFYTLKNGSITNVVPTMYSIGVALPVILSYLFYNEILNKYKVIGVLSIVFGICLVNIN